MDGKREPLGLFIERAVIRRANRSVRGFDPCRIDIVGRQGS